VKKRFTSLHSALMAVCLLLTALPGQAANLSIITVDPTGKPVGSLTNKGYSLSSNGRYVAFSSGQKLSIHDTNSSVDVYIRDIVTNKTLLASIDLAGRAAGKVDTSLTPLLTPDGRYVVFGSNANDLVSNDTDDKRDIFIRDLSTNTTKLITANKTGQASSGKERNYQISADGRFVIFESNANDVVTNDTNNAWDIFVRDTKTNTTKLVSMNSAATDSGNAESVFESFGTTGRFIKFRSRADNLVANDTNGKADCFVRNLQTNRTILLQSCDTFASTDNRYMAFSIEKSLTKNDTNNKKDVYRHDLEKNTLELVSINSKGKASINSQAEARAMSDNGRYVMFDSNATDMVKNYNKNSQYVSKNVYVRDLVSKTTRLVSMNAAGKAIGGHGFLLSDNGQTALFSSDTAKIPYQFSDGKWALFSRNLATNKTTLFSVTSAKLPIVGKYQDSLFDDFNYPQLSADGAVMAFSSQRKDLTAHDNNQTIDVFVKSLKNGLTRLISMNYTGSNSGNRSSDTPVLSADGKVVVFKSSAHNLVANDTSVGNNFFAKRIR